MSNCLELNKRALVDSTPAFTEVSRLIFTPLGANLVAGVLWDVELIKVSLGDVKRLGDRIIEVGEQVSSKSRDNN